MELLFLGVFGLVSGWVVGTYLNGRRETKSSFKTNITRIDNKNWIVDGRFESLEEDTELNRFKQRQEDNKHYHNYERTKLQHDRKRIINDYLKTKRAIDQFPDMKECITKEKLDAITDKYDKYIEMCDKLQESIRLTKEEFLIKEENPVFCVDFSVFMMIPENAGCYTIYNGKTAKYKGDTEEKIREEFKKKWY